MDSDMDFTLACDYHISQSTSKYGQCFPQCAEDKLLWERITSVLLPPQHVNQVTLFIVFRTGPFKMKRQCIQIGFFFFVPSVHYRLNNNVFHISPISESLVSPERTVTRHCCPNKCYYGPNNSLLKSTMKWTLRKHRPFTETCLSRVPVFGCVTCMCVCVKALPTFHEAELTVISCRGEDHLKRINRMSKPPLPNKTHNCSDHDSQFHKLTRISL